MTAPYNPLEKHNLALSIEAALLISELKPLGDLDLFDGAGVYALYYRGTFKPYQPLAQLHVDGQQERPIYVGKAIPAGGRKAGLLSTLATGRPLNERIRKHTASIGFARNLAVDDFFVRYLVVDDIWIPLGENMLIERFKPLWNRVIDGFGNNDPGVRRKDQYCSPWDVLHPGRPWAEKLAPNPVSVETLVDQVAAYFAGKSEGGIPIASDGDVSDDDEEPD